MWGLGVCERGGEGAKERGEREIHWGSVDGEGGGERTKANQDKIKEIEGGRA